MLRILCKSSFLNAFLTLSYLDHKEISHFRYSLFFLDGLVTNGKFCFICRGVRPFESGLLKNQGLQCQPCATTKNPS